MRQYLANLIRHAVANGLPKKLGRHFTTRKWSVAAAMMLGLSSTSAHAGYGDWLELQIANPDPAAPFTFKIGQVTCLNTIGAQFQMSSSQRVTTGRSYTVPVGGEITLGFNHNAGSHCDDRPSDFSIHFTTTNIRGAVANNVVYFRAYESSEITLNNQDFKGASPYVGESFLRNGKGNSELGRWRWTPKVPPLRLAKGEGDWKLVCNSVCSQVEITKGVSSSKSTTAEQSRERKTAMSITAEIGIEYAGASASLSTTASDERTSGQSIAKEIASASSTEVKQTYPKPQGWRNLWQWYVTMKAVGGTEQLTYDSNKFTCSMTDNPPAYFPDSGASKAGECSVLPPPNAAAKENATRAAAVAKENAARAAAVAKENATRAAAAARLASCVTFYSAPNGGGSALTLCGDDYVGKTYINLGSSGAAIHSHHYKVMSFMCGAGIDTVLFINGNANPLTSHPESCKGGNTWIHPNPWVKANGTGVGLYLPNSQLYHPPGQ